LRLTNFQSREFGQLRQVVQQCEGRPDREVCFRLLGERLLSVYEANKQQLKRLRADYPTLAPYLVKS